MVEGNPTGVINPAIIGGAECRATVAQAAIDSTTIRLTNRAQVDVNILINLPSVASAPIRSATPICALLTASRSDTDDIECAWCGTPYVRFDEVIMHVGLMLIGAPR